MTEGEWDQDGDGYTLYVMGHSEFALQTLRPALTATLIVIVLIALYQLYRESNVKRLTKVLSARPTVQGRNGGRGPF